MSDAIIKIDDLKFSWPNQSQTTLDIKALEIDPGQTLFIEGPSGSGKTSLLNLIGAVTEPTAGTIDVLGQSLNTLKGAAKDQFRADHIGFIFQQFNLLPYLSMLENITLPCHFSRARRTKALDSGNLMDEAKRLLSHLQMNDPNLVNKPVTQLSVGQQQRVAAARALIGRPEIIIADEPTSALDANTRESFIQLLFNECEQSGSTLIFVSHDSALASLFDRRVVLPELSPISEQRLQVNG